MIGKVQDPLAKAMRGNGKFKGLFKNEGSRNDYVRINPWG